MRHKYLVERLMPVVLHKGKNKEIEKGAKKVRTSKSQFVRDAIDEKLDKVLK